MRYDSTKILKDSVTGIRYYRGVKYPYIPEEDDDIYIITAFGDRLDLIAYDYYRSVDDYWIIMAANNIPRDSIFPPPGIQLRIPVNISNARSLFNKLNEV